MDVILSRLDPQQLRGHCRAALQQELQHTFELLQQALAAAQRAEEVQRAASSLAAGAVPADAALLLQLERIESLRLQLCISLDHVARGAQQPEVAVAARSLKREERGIVLELLSPADSDAETPATTSANIIDLSLAVEATAPTTTPPSRKRKLSVASASEQQPPASKKFVFEFREIRRKSGLGRAVDAALDCAAQVMKRKVGERVLGQTMLASKTAAVVKKLESADKVETDEAMDALAHLAAVQVGVLVKAKQNAKRSMALKALNAIQDLQTKFPDAASLFDKSYASLSKYIGSTFPLSAKETDELRRRVRAAIKDMRAWEAGAYSVSDFHEKMRIVKLAIDSHCSNWSAKKDLTVLELLDALVARLSGFKDSLAQGKRRETLLSWRAEMKVKGGASTPVKSGRVKSSSDSGVAASSRMTPQKETPSSKMTPHKEEASSEMTPQEAVVEVVALNRKRRQKAKKKHGKRGSGAGGAHEITSTSADTNAIVDISSIT